MEWRALLRPQRGQASFDFAPALARRPLECSYCGRGISNMSNLRKHVRRAHGTTSTQCPYCGKAYRAFCDLRRHALNAHNLNLWPPVASPPQGADSSAASSLIYDDNGPEEYSAGEGGCPQGLFPSEDPSFPQGICPC